MPVPLILVTGFAGAGKSSLIAHCLGQQPEGALWLGFSNTHATESQAGGASSVSSASRRLFQAGFGCMHCIGLLPTQVALTRALASFAKRGHTPQAVFLEAPADAHLADALRALQRPPLSDLVALRQVVAVFRAAWIGPPLPPALGNLARQADVLLANHWAACEDATKGVRSQFEAFASACGKPWFSADFGVSEYSPIDALNA